MCTYVHMIAQNSGGENILLLHVHVAAWKLEDLIW